MAKTKERTGKRASGKRPGSRAGERANRDGAGPVGDPERLVELYRHRYGMGTSVALIAEGCYAKLVEGTTAELGMSVHAHPTLAEIVGEAALAVTGQAINF